MPSPVYCFLQRQRRVAGARRMVLVGDRCAEQSHDAVAGVLIDRPLEAVNSVGEDLEEALHDPVPVFGIDRLREIHRPLHVGEENRHLLALAFKRAAGREDLFRQVFWRVGAGIRSRGLSQQLSARVAELPTFGVRSAAARAGQCRGKGRGAFAAELRSLAIVAAAAWALHL